MDLAGYVTLVYASEISGKNVEALKKQCQTGRIRGAIKKGNNWLVPRTEIIVGSTSTDDPDLNIIINVVEASSHPKTLGGIGITIYLAGKTITGTLISKDEYAKKYAEIVQGLVVATTDDEKLNKQTNEKWAGFVSEYFSSYSKKDEKAMQYKYLYLTNVSEVDRGMAFSHDKLLLKVKIDSIDGFAIGRIALLSK